ncbi:hypothetical protein JMJ55_09910 [Belnapia sp. T6]|uniref:Uncharacterized protein n=1 Tax=Belnapia mucosa TaxID=2804532 RepID=A0ABS1V1S9_9PROT|nr:hypothetical protein [Belnapia mucosa]MBL6455638.1 hypothetical protein [Belnapia mucosa]
MTRHLALALVLALVAGPVRAQGVACMAPAATRDWQSPAFGLGMRHPASFRLEDTSRDTARFVSLDGQASATVTAIRNGLRQSLAEVMAEARQDILENSGGTITYSRARESWFVLSGYMAGRIFYRRSLLSADGRVIGTLWVEFPRAMKPCFEAAVTIMSLSFREAAR